MDTQIKFKLGIRKGKRISTEIIEFNNSIMENKVIFEFQEYDFVKIDLVTNSKEVQVKIYTSTDIGVLTGDNSRYIISNYKDEKLLVPGIYKITIIDDKKSIICFFKVNPQTIEWSELKNIKRHLEELQIDLSKELFSTRVNSDGNYLIGKSNYNLYNYIMDNKEVLQLNLVNILNNPLSIISKTYDFHNISKKPDYKTYKKYATNGVNPFERHNNIKHYEKRVCVNYDIPENRWLFQIVIKLIQRIKDLQKSLISNEVFIKSKLDEFYNSLENYNLKKHKIKNIIAIAEEYKQDNKLSIFVVENKIKEHKDMLKKLNTMRSALNPVIQQLNQVIEHHILANLTNINRPMKYSLKIMKDRRYSWLYRYSNEILMFNNGVKENKDYYKSKPTYELFEYFNLILIVKIILSLGFEWVDGWLASENEIDEELLSGTRLKFIKNTEEIFLDYDNEIRDTSSNSESGFVTINSKNRRPDILLSHFVEGHISKAVVFEVKYRKSCYLYNCNGDTKVLKQMKNYLQLAYYDKITGLKRDVIEKVVTLYPTQKFLVDFNDIMFNEVLKYIDIKTDTNLMSTLGYKKIKNIIIEVLEKSLIMYD